MKKTKIAVASGKGGVGKSMVASSLALMFAKKRQIVAVDCDVDAPNLHLWLGQTENWDEKERISTNELPVVDNDKCVLCEKCVDICAFDALSIKNKQVKVNKFFCEGCGACEAVCPKAAITMKQIKNAEVRLKKHLAGFPLISAQLDPEQTGSGKIVEEIKQKAESLQYQIMIFDAPAGTGCPVIAALNGVDFVVLVTEPTPSGIADLRRVLTVVDHFHLPFRLIINKWDINPQLSKKIEEKFSSNLIGKISYEKGVFKAIAKLKPIMKTSLKTKQELKKIYQKLVRVIE
jgi:MinD superfamily P-loop ATPase